MDPGDRRRDDELLSKSVSEPMGACMNPVFALPSAQLRPAVEKDLDAFCRLLWDADVRRHLCDDMIYDRDKIAELLAAAIALDARQLGIWVVEAGDGEVVGHGALTPAIHPALAGRVEVGISLLPGYWRRGLASAVVHALAVHAASACRLDRIVAAVDAPNERSHRLMLRTGFERTGEGPGPKQPQTFYERRLRVPD